MGPFCRARGITEARFTVAKTAAENGAGAIRAAGDRTAADTASPDSALELVLANGERLRIGNGVDAATLRMVLEVVRG